MGVESGLGELGGGSNSRTRWRSTGALDCHIGRGYHARLAISILLSVLPPSGIAICSEFLSNDVVPHFHRIKSAIPLRFWFYGPYSRNLPLTAGLRLSTGTPRYCKCLDLPFPLADPGPLSSRSHCITDISTFTSLAMRFSAHSF